MTDKNTPYSMMPDHTCPDWCTRDHESVVARLGELYVLADACSAFDDADDVNQMFSDHTDKSRIEHWRDFEGLEDVPADVQIFGEDSGPVISLCVDEMTPQLNAEAARRLAHVLTEAADKLSEIKEVYQ